MNRGLHVRRDPGTREAHTRPGRMGAEFDSAATSPPLSRRRSDQPFGRTRDRRGRSGCRVLRKSACRWSFFRSGYREQASPERSLPSPSSCVATEAPTVTMGSRSSGRWQSCPDVRSTPRMAVFDLGLGPKHHIHPSGTGAGRDCGRLLPQLR